MSGTRQGYKLQGDNTLLIVSLTLYVAYDTAISIVCTSHTLAVTLSKTVQSMCMCMQSVYQSAIGVITAKV